MSHRLPIAFVILRVFPTDELSREKENPEACNSIVSYDRRVIRIRMEKGRTSFRVTEGEPLTVEIYGRGYKLGPEELSVPFVQ